jgi:hypothetical protein
MLNTTNGTSFSAASAMASCMRAMPWPQEPVPARAPAAAAPRTMFTPSISLSAFMHVPPTSGSRRAMFSSSSVNGSIG